ncbi:6-phosphogluconate dehydrogenase [Kosmotoga arenicorallina S304]|uniref:6-phosphogluconate dehydrogenase n=1 Tax=Kosmotoga arenicorallina S304 TaxID=1453497 RepID=A0A176JUX9_9BACT|nr:decarboxylating 6-phosphogluconate dehydrogenase [Kosmotoga arenicorallina]OAA27232.1 6-phosphogluconate dehydrogenase [Kosmotoga arenicorallina S304]
MKIAILGLGRMGFNMSKRLIKNGHEVYGYDKDQEKVKLLEREGAKGIRNLSEIAKIIDSPRVVWLMLPSGVITESALEEVSQYLKPGDVVVDGSNGHYKEDKVRESKLKDKGIIYMDAGVSGGIWGYEVGYCTMVGGNKKAFEFIEPILRSLAPKEGYLYCGPSGAGHFVKMIHNGIEYAIMEAYGEGFEILKASEYSEYFKLEEVAHLWNQGSIIRSWLLELLEEAFKKDPELETIQGIVPDSGEARWTVQAAVDLGVSATGIAHSLFKRFQSRQVDVFSDKILAALRKEFGGHAVYKKGNEVRSRTAGAGPVKHADPSEEWKISNMEGN